MLAADGVRVARPKVSLKGRAEPRVCPPTPARSQVREFTAQAKAIGIDLIPWQKVAARYLTALGRDDRWLYPEIAAIVARQNGKTEELVPLVVQRLRNGKRIMHTAQNRDLPREVFRRVADAMLAHYPDELARMKRAPWVRYGSGQEEIRTTNGGTYRIVAPTRGGARGPSNDLVIVDELREMVDWDFIAAAKPTLTASKNPQILYLSNAGTDDSVVLNALRKRAETDPSLAYLEWSAAGERRPDDRAGWLEANPSVGHLPHMWDYLERQYRTSELEDTLAIFETEHLCRWVVTIQPPLIEPKVWADAEGDTGAALRPVMGISLDPSGSRASAAIAWRVGDAVMVRVLADVTGDPIDLERFGPELKALASRLRITRVVYSPYDDHLARFFPSPIKMDTLAYANASSAFARLLEGGQLCWQDAGAIGEDLPWATRKRVGPDAWVAVKRKEDRPITAVRAAIEAVGLASAPQPAAPRVL
jgi:hypothetical protein